MPLFAAGVSAATKDGGKEQDNQYIGQIYPATMLSIIRVQNEQKKFDPVSLVDPMPEVEKKQKKKEKKEKKRKRDEGNDGDSRGDIRDPREVEPAKGVYYSHQVNDALFC